jgi:hypothetical protein
MRLILYIALILVCRATLLASYNLAQSGGDLYDFTGNGYNAVVSRNGGLPYVISDRGYYIQDKATIQFPCNSYKFNPAKPMMLLGIWHYTLKPGIFITFNFKSSSSSSVFHIKWLKSTTNQIQLEILRDGISKIRDSLDNSIYGICYIDVWRFSIFSLYDNSGNIKFEYYRRTHLNIDVSYTFSDFSLQNLDISWSINSASGGITGFIYQVYWYDSDYTSLSPMFDTTVTYITSGSPCYFRPTYGTCFSTSPNPFINTVGSSCNICSQNTGSCYTSLSGCISPNCVTGITPECLCINNCIDCDNDTSNVLVCSKCDNGFSILEGTPKYSCTTTCPQEYYKDTSSISTCRRCELNCKICSNDTACTSCNSGFYLKNGECVSDCGDGYYLSTSTCLSCESDCKTCSSNTLCTVCNSGYYLSSSDCLACESNCDVCSNSTACSLCNTGFYLKNEDCVSDCGDGYYISNNDCLTCGTNCKSCNSDTACISCNSEYYLKNEDCVISCGDGYYISSTDCLDCESNCKSCSSDTVCNQCNSEFYLKKEDCVSNCGDGYYISSTDCLDCESNCKSCSSDTICNQCNTGFYLKNGDCVSDCGNGYYISSTDCLDCESNCKSCSSDTVCNECNSVLYLKNGDCVTSCGDGYYISRTDCLACETNCKDCTIDKICTLCFNGYYLKNGDCVSNCGDGYYLSFLSCFECESNCKICSSDTICTLCNAGYYLRNQDCVSDCGNGYYISSTDCLDCESNCKTCSSYTVCTECNSSYFLKNGDCVTNCGDGYYLSFSSCFECESSCKTCSHETVCTECNSSYFLKNGDCVSNCGDGYYLDTPGCQPCSAYCIMCSSDTACNECDSNFYLKAGECVLDCGEGYYSTSGICHPCSINCRSCTDTNICNSCISSYYLKGETCVLGCGLEYYPELDSCKECKSGCSICSNEFDCLMCKDGYVLSDFECIRCIRGYILDSECIDECGDGYYIQDRVCHKCSNNCRLCKNRDCEECYSGYYFEEGECVDECRFGYGINGNRCDKCEESSVVVNGVCEICDYGYYAEGSTCEKCPELCRDCIDDFNCTECMNHSSLVDGLCECNQSFFKHESMCIRGIITPNATLTSNNTIEFGFNIPLDFSLSPHHLSLSLDSNQISQSSYSLYELYANQSYYITLSCPISTNSTLIIYLTPTFKSQTLDYVLSTDNVSLTTNFNTTDSNSDIQASRDYLSNNPNAAKIQGQTRTQTMSISSTVLSFAITGSTSVWCFINTLQIISIIPLINVDLPDYLFAVLTGSRSYIPIPNFIGKLVPKEGSTSFYRAYLLGFSRPEFIYNTGEALSGIIAIILIYPILLLIRKLTRAKYSKKYLFKLLESYISNYRWNVFLRFLLESYLEITLSAFIQLYQYDFLISPSPNELANFSICIIFLVIYTIDRLITISYIYILSIIKHL